MRLGAISGVVLVVWLLGCSERERPPPPRAGSGGSAGAAFDAGAGGAGPPPADAGGLCGNQILPVQRDRPNLYFVLDRSGSMADPLEGSAYDKYTSARLAIAEVLRSIGHRVSYGAAVFPAFDLSRDECTTGEQVFATQRGDDFSYAQSGENGPILLSLLSTLAAYPPRGGTPVSATLSALVPTLDALPGETLVVLATDGAPNCNPIADCDIDECTLNIERVNVSGETCADTFNCCDPLRYVEGPLFCIDSGASLLAIEALAQAGIRTFVVGMPGSERYATLLGQMAEAGETARDGQPRYYATTSIEELTGALKTIGTSVAISCDVALDAPPPDPQKVNVYLDEQLVGFDPDDGWAWTGDDSLRLNGEACARLQSGDVFQLQVVAGCTTVVK